MVVDEAVATPHVIQILLLLAKHAGGSLRGQALEHEIVGTRQLVLLLPFALRANWTQRGDVHLRRGSV